MAGVMFLLYVVHWCDVSERKKERKKERILDQWDCKNDIYIKSIEL